MRTRRFLCIVFLMVGAASGAHSQAVVPSYQGLSEPQQSQTISLTVPKGTPIQIALDREIRVKRVGQPVHGRVVQPMYAFDRLVIPLGTEALGQITKIYGISAKKRTLGIMNGDFTPAGKIELEFNELVLPDGKHIPVRTTVTPGSGQIIQLVNSGEKEKRTRKDVAAEKIKEAKRQAKQEWKTAMAQVKNPGKVHRLERLAVAELPVHPQYIDAGTVYFADLEEPLDFGTETLTSQTVSSIETPPPEGSLVHTLLVTPLNSAVTQKGAEVEAVVSKPLFDGNRLIIPQGSRLKGSVAQVRPARYMHHNGQLRVVLHELLPPSGTEEQIVASLEGVQASKADNVRLDSEGGAEATSSKARYLALAISLGLGVASFGGDADDLINHGAGGANGFRLVGMALGASVRSSSLGYGMGAYGAGMSVYTHFISRGRDVVFPKDTAMEIGFGRRVASPEKSAKPNVPRQ